jgi:hypothetical protein
MARFLLIEFENDAQAEMLRAKIDAETRKGKPFRVAGLFARPRKFCNCPKPVGYHKNQVTRGVKFGWNVCTICRRVVAGSHRANNLLTAQELMMMPGETPSRGLEYRADTVGIFEVPVRNIERDAEDNTETKEL